MYLFRIAIYSFTYPYMYNYISNISKFCYPNNMEYMFVVCSSFVCLHVDHDFCKASLCMFIYILTKLL